MSHFDPYEILGIDRDATPEDIKTAYRKKALIHHPDKGGDEEQFKKLHLAYKALSEPNNTQNSFQPGFQPQSFFAMFDIFNNIFEEKKKTPPIVKEEYISFEQLCKKEKVKVYIDRFINCSCVKNITICNGCGGSGQRNISLNNIMIMIGNIGMCNICNGRGIIGNFCKECTNGEKKEKKIFTIELNEQLVDNPLIILKEEGDHLFQKSKGDLHISFKIIPHPDFKNEGYDLIYENEISLKEALCGHTINIVHPDGENINLTPNVVMAPNNLLRITGKGICCKGDMIIHYKIKFPKTLTDKQIKILEKVL